jgi:hypothetical protein
MEIDPATTPEYPHGKPKAWIKTKNTNERIYNSTGNPEQKSNGITNGYFEPTKSLINQYAEQETRPSTPRINTATSTGTSYGNAGRKTLRRNGACSVMGGRAKSRRAKSRRARRS